MRTGAKWGLGIAAVAVIGLLAAPPSFSPFNQGLSRPGELGDSAIDVPGSPRNFSVTTFEGERFRLRDHRGKPVVLNFWESW